MSISHSLIGQSTLPPPLLICPATREIQKEMKREMLRASTLHCCIDADQHCCFNSRFQNPGIAKICLTSPNSSRVVNFTQKMDKYNCWLLTQKRVNYHISESMITFEKYVHYFGVNDHFLETSDHNQSNIPKLVSSSVVDENALN